MCLHLCFFFCPNKLCSTSCFSVSVRTTSAHQEGVLNLHIELLDRWGVEAQVTKKLRRGYTENEATTRINPCSLHKYSSQVPYLFAFAFASFIPLNMTTIIWSTTIDELCVLIWGCDCWLCYTVFTSRNVTSNVKITFATVDGATRIVLIYSLGPHHTAFFSFYCVPRRIFFSFDGM